MPTTQPAWLEPVRISRQAFEYAPAFAVDAAGYAHVAAASRSGEGIYYMTNASGSWTAGQLTRPPRDGTDNVPALAVDEDGSVHISFARWQVWNPCYMECPQGPASRVDGLYYTTNAGGGWAEPVKLPGEIGSAIVEGDSAMPFAVADGSLHVAYARRGIWHATNASGNWTFERVSERGGGPSLAVTDDGRAVIAFAVDDGGIYVASQSVLGGPFSVSVVPQTETGGWPRLGLDELDEPGIVYVGGDDRSTYFTQSRNDQWATPTRLAEGFAVNAAVDASGRPHVLHNVWDETPTQDGLWYVTDRGAGPEALRIHESTRVVYDGPTAPSALAVDSLGRPHVLIGVQYDGRRQNGLWYTLGPAFERTE